MAITPTPENQNTVTRLALVGIIISAVVFTAGWKFLPVQEGRLMSTADKLSFTLRWQVLASFILVFAIQRIGSIRHKGPIDPTQGDGGLKMLGVNARFLSNTLEQLVINFLSQLVLTTYLGDNLQRVIPTLVVLFVVGRIVFLVGYKMNPLYRAPGFVMTFIPCAITHVYCIYCLLVYGPLFGLQ